MFDPITLLAGVLPVFVEAGKAAVNRWIAPDHIKPTNVDDAIKLRESEIKFFEAITNAGGSNPSYPWVEAVVRLQRPAVAATVLAVWAASKLWFPEHNGAVDNFAAAIGFYLFGDRTLFYAKKKT